jgi:hypothetical protein
MSIFESNKPVFVLDLNANQGMSGESSKLPDGYWYVLPDTALREVATTCPNRRIPQLVKMYDFLRSNSSKLLLSKYWQDVSRAEHHAGYASERPALIEWNLTRSLWNREFPPVEEFLENSANLDLDIDQHESDRLEFIQFIEAVADSRRMSEHYSGKLINEMCSSSESRTMYIRQPDVFASWIEHHPNQKYRSPEWKEQLLQYPDCHAMGRMLRIYRWYEMTYTIGYRIKKFGNNFEDAQYVFTSSYFDGLISNDNGVKECTQAIFPSVTVLSSVCELDSASHKKAMSA